MKRGVVFGSVSLLLVHSSRELRPPNLPSRLVLYYERFPSFGLVHHLSK